MLLGKDGKRSCSSDSASRYGLGSRSGRAAAAQRGGGLQEGRWTVGQNNGEEGLRQRQGQELQWVRHNGEEGLRQRQGEELCGKNNHRPQAGMDPHSTAAA